MRKLLKAAFIVSYALLWAEVYTHNEEINDILDREAHWDAER